MKTVYPTNRIDFNKWLTYLRVRNYNFKSSRIARAYFEWLNDK